MKKKEMMEIGLDGEVAFADWLNDENVGYLRITQSREFFSKSFSEVIKRPDFLVLLPSIGFIAVDVKHFSLDKRGGFTLTIPTELIPATEFESATRLYLWYAYKNRSDPSDENWYFISARRAMEEGTRHVNQKKNQGYLSIPLSKFHILQTADDFGKLFNARVGSMGRMTRALTEYFTKIDDKEIRALEG